MVIPHGRSHIALPASQASEVSLPRVDEGVVAVCGGNVDNSDTHGVDAGKSVLALAAGRILHIKYPDL